MIFIYKARNKQGLLVSGEVEGSHSAAVRHALVSQNLFPVSVQPKGFEMSLKSLLQRRVTNKDIVKLTRQIQVMFEAGTPMDRILETAEKQTQHEGLKQALRKIHDDVSSGLTLSQAFAKHPKYFSSLYVNMLTVGETGGILDKTLKEMVKIIESEYQIKAKIKTAMLYPKIVFGALMAVTVLMLNFVIPAFGDFYAKFNAELPLPTRILIGLSDFFVGYWPALLAIVVILAE